MTKLMTKLDYAKANTFKWESCGHNNDCNNCFWCYLCGKKISWKQKNFDIDHIKPECQYNKDQNSSKNPIFGKYKNKWLKYFDKISWQHNNLTIVHKKCNKNKGNKDESQKYKEEFISND